MYTRQNWQAGDVITAAKMNNLEEGVAEAGVHPLDRIESGTGASADSYTLAGLYWLEPATVTDIPGGASGILSVSTNQDKSIVFQTFYGYGSNGLLATRFYVENQWREWNQRPTVTPISAGGTGATTAENALSALGGAPIISRGAYFGSLTNVGNTPGTLYDNSVVWFATSNGTTDAPKSGFGLCTTWSQGGGYLQEVKYIDGSYYWRMYYDDGNGNAWHNWYKVSTSSV